MSSDTWGDLRPKEASAVHPRSPGYDLKGRAMGASRPMYYNEFEEKKGEVISLESREGKPIGTEVGSNHASATRKRDQYPRVEPSRPWDDGSDKWHFHCNTVNPVFCSPRYSGLLSHMGLIPWLKISLL